MLFSSLTFLLLFLPITLLLYALVPKGGKNAVLLLASLLFYAWGEPVYLILMLLSILVNYAFGRLLGVSLRRRTRPYRNIVLFFAILWNLTALGYFKYAELIAGTINRFAPSPAVPVSTVALPIGISFYTFQAMSYLIDVRRGEVKPQKNLFDFALYISMFPQLIAGPIVRYADIHRELRSRRFSVTGLSAGAELFLRGLIKKVLLANRFGSLTNAVKALPGGGESIAGAWLLALAYALQIYFDFSGYSDMAVGLGRMFGFHFPKNFDHPYISGSVTEFWRRWHMTLGTWFKEYVYIPLGGNRKGLPRQIRNLLIVWALTGIWHGASYNFLLWGLYYGILLILEKIVLLRVWKKIPPLGHLCTGLSVLIGWILFFETDLSVAGARIGQLFGFGSLGFWENGIGFLFTSYGAFLLAGCFAATPFPRLMEQKLSEHVPIATAFLRGILLVWVLASLVSQSYNPFLYFRF